MSTDLKPTVLKVPTTSPTPGKPVKTFGSEGAKEQEIRFFPPQGQCFASKPQKNGLFKLFQAIGNILPFFRQSTDEQLVLSLVQELEHQLNDGNLTFEEVGKRQRIPVKDSVVDIYRTEDKVIIDGKTYTFRCDAVEGAYPWWYNWKYSLTSEDGTYQLRSEGNIPGLKWLDSEVHYHDHQKGLDLKCRSRTVRRRGRKFFEKLKAMGKKKRKEARNQARLERQIHIERQEKLNF